MNTLREYVTALGLPAASNPASRTFAADEHRSARSSPRACSRVVASSTFRVAPSRARRSTRRIAEAAGCQPDATGATRWRPESRIDELGNVVIVVYYFRNEEVEAAQLRLVFAAAITAPCRNPVVPYRSNSPNPGATRKPDR